MKNLIINRQASFNYEIIDRYEAGIQLMGSEVKSLKNGNGNMSDSYCIFIGNELFIKSMHISPYTESGKLSNHEPIRNRKLLLHKKELKKLSVNVEAKGLSIIPLRVYVNDKNLIKVEIALCKGKKNYDKRNSIKQKDIARDTQRTIKGE